jgi:hypothetical protein
MSRIVPYREIPTTNAYWEIVQEKINTTEIFKESIALGTLIQKILQEPGHWFIRNEMAIISVKHLSQLKLT